MLLGSWSPSRRNIEHACLRKLESVQPSYNLQRVLGWNNWSINDVSVNVLMLRQWITSGRNIIRIYSTWGCRRAFNWKQTKTLLTAMVWWFLCESWAWCSTVLHVCLFMHENMYSICTHDHVCAIYFPCLCTQFRFSYLWQPMKADIFNPALHIFPLVCVWKCVGMCVCVYLYMWGFICLERCV